MSHSVNCWRCDRKLAETEGIGQCSAIVYCKRCGAKNRIDFRAEPERRALDNAVSSGILRIVK